jgi:hypothetical protein
MPRDYDEARGDEWFCTIYVDDMLGGSQIHLVGSSKGLKLYTEDVPELDDRKIHQLVLALQRFERWHVERFASDPHRT